MRYRQLGNTGLSLSELGIGGSHFGSMTKRSNPKEIEQMLRQAFDCGINFYDTADIYGQGESERIIGQAFAKCRDQVVIATKAGFCLSESGKLAAKLKPLIKPLIGVVKPFRQSLVQARASQIQQDFSGDYLIRSVERSLQRLKTDYIDLFQLHEPPTDAILESSMLTALESLKEQGKIRFYGITCGNVEDALLSLQHAGYASIQVEFNLYNWSVVNPLLPQAQIHGKGIIARQPFASGQLFQQLKSQSLGSHITTDRVIQAALQSVLQHEAVSTVIAGMRSQAHLSNNLSALYASLSSQEMSDLTTAMVPGNEEISCC